MAARFPAHGQVQLPIVPLLDMSFQLMFFFVITLHAGGPEGRISLLLPSDSKAEPVLNQPQAAVAAAPLELPSDLVVNVRGDGPDGLRICIRAADQVMEVKDSTALEEVLKAHRIDPATGRTGLQLEAEGRIKYVRLVEVLDACKRAGYGSISLALATEN
jgi:biopolymer transport protein ExbD